MGYITKILVLFGNGNKGKTETLDSLITKLAGPNEENIIEEIKYGKDRCCIIKYKNKLLKITTRGDNKYCLNRDYNLFPKYKNKVDIFICAARSKGKTHEYINEGIPRIDNVNVENIYWLSKRSISDYSCNGKICSDEISNHRKKQNEEQVQEILCLLEKILKVRFNKKGLCQEG